MTWHARIDSSSSVTTIVQRDTGELGMHLHPWNTPPIHSLTDDDNKYHPYLIEYPAALIRDKVAFMTELLRDTFSVPVRSHRAGRWAFNHVYAQALMEQGYHVDCSVTPHISWTRNAGDPRGRGGSDYRQFPQYPYFVSCDDISKPGDSALLEVPMSIMPCRSSLINGLRGRCVEGSVPRRVLDRYFPASSWFRPTRNNLSRMRKVFMWSREQGLDYIEFMLHSSELMPGGSPTFANRGRHRAAVQRPRPAVRDGCWLGTRRNAFGVLRLVLCPRWEKGSHG